MQGRIAGIGSVAWLSVSAGVLALFLGRRGRSDVTNDDEVAQRVSKTEDSTMLRVDPGSKTVSLGGIPVELTKKPFDLLSLLASEDGRVFSEEEILRELWPEAPYADSGDVRQCVYMLRKRLDKGVQGGGRCIVNVKGFGYKLDASCIYAVHTEAER